MSDEEIIALLKSNETDQRKGLRLLYQGKGQEFGRYFVRNRMPYALAEEAVQEVIIKILRHAKDFTGEGSAKSWMWSMARNILIDWARREKRHPEVGLTEQEWSNEVFRDRNDDSKIKPLQPQAPEVDISVSIENCVQSGINRFAADEPERAYVISLHIEGVDGQEIAERIGRTYEATKQYLFQCRKKLSPYISECMPLLND